MTFADGESVRMKKHPQRRGYISGAGYRSGGLNFVAVRWEHGLVDGEQRDHNGTYPAQRVATTVLEYDQDCDDCEGPAPVETTRHEDGHPLHLCDSCGAEWDDDQARQQLEDDREAEADRAYDRMIDARMETES